MKTIILSLLVFLSALVAQERYSRITLPGATSRDLARIEELGIAADHFGGKLGDAVTLFVSESEQRLLTKSGIPFRVDIADWDEYYRTENAHRMRSAKSAGSDSVKNFEFGSKGGHYTLAEMLNVLTHMKQVFPNLITEKVVIGKSFEDRDIIAVRISAVPESTGTAAPEVLYTGVHHAREPQGCTGLIYYMWWLMENYQKDPKATYLLDHRQLWFIPIVNPDGYEYNGAGGMWRKNRRPLSGGNVGVDLNRNYGNFTMWNAPNGGSSTSGSSDTYRGTVPFSEPETQSIRNFTAQHSFKTCFNYHTYGNYLIYPWGYSSSESPDSLLFRYWTYDMSALNRYSNGTDMETVGYSTRGNSDDYLYGDSAKSRTYAMTPEIGTSGFYAFADEIIPLSNLNIPQNTMLAFAAGGYPEIRSFTRTGLSVSVVLFNKGLSTLPSMPLYLTTNAGIVQASVQCDSIPSLSSDTVTFSITAGANTGRTVVRLTDGTGGLLNDSIQFYTSSPTIIFSDSAGSAKNWSMGSWGTVPDVLTGNSVFADSPSGPYGANTDNSMTMTSTIDLTALYQSAELRFRTKWSIESTWDFATVEISTNNGSVWTSLRTQYSRKGAGRNAVQPVTAYGYDAYVPGLTWVEQTADLTPYVGKEIKIRFRMRSDAGDQRDGWYVDDIRILGYVGTPAAVAENGHPPYEYELQQNFPNPFNPSTTIRFSVQETGHTTLAVYNSIGQRVAVVLDRVVPAGTHAINFDAGLLSSGLYFYRFTSGTYSAIKRMALIQ